MSTQDRRLPQNERLLEWHSGEWIMRTRDVATDMRLALSSIVECSKTFNSNYACYFEDEQRSDFTERTLKGTQSQFDRLERELNAFENIVDQCNRLIKDVSVSSLERHLLTKYGGSWK